MCFILYFTQRFFTCFALIKGPVVNLYLILIKQYDNPFVIINTINRYTIYI